MTEAESLSHMKKMTATCISSILYYRGFFPEDDYGVRSHEGRQYHILDRNTKTEEAKTVITTIMSLFEAITKKYLKTLVIGFVTDPEETDVFLEGYIFRYKYESPSMTVSGNRSKIGHISSQEGSQVVQETIQLLDQIKNNCQRMKLYKRRVYLTMKVLYNQDTPLDFEPKGFSKTDKHEFELDAEQTQEIHAGKVSSRFHVLKMRMDVDKRLMVE